MPDGSSHTVTRWRAGVADTAMDEVVVEEPLEIRVAGVPIVTLMRTPGRDDELAAGFLFTEGLLTSPAQIGAIHHCPDPQGDAAPNVVNLLPSVDCTLDLAAFQRTFPAGSSCGICGKTSIDQIRRRQGVLADPLRLTIDRLTSLVQCMSACQPVFARTGSIHAAALFDPRGDLLLIREDIGRHNAVDRVVGRRVLDDQVPCSGLVLAVTGRITFEIVQKALAARIPIVAAISGASSLAIELACSANMTLAGFVRGSSCTVYCGAERIHA